MELWKDIDGYRGIYQISNKGNVRSLDRIVSHAHDNRSRKFKGVVLKPVRAKNTDHLSVQLSTPVLGAKRFFIHLLVLKTFGPPKPDGNYECLHINGQADDNRIENLRWGTRSENIRDAVRMGTHSETRKTHCKFNHEYTDENTIRWPSQPNSRRCRQCETDRSKRRRSAKSA